MTDLAAPLLWVFEGDPVKSFWCFVGLLNLTKKNFEMEQTTVKNLLIKLFKLVNLTDPCFAEFLGNYLSASPVTFLVASLVAIAVQSVHLSGSTQNHITRLVTHVHSCSLMLTHVHPVPFIKSCGHHADFKFVA